MWIGNCIAVGTRHIHVLIIICCCCYLLFLYFLDNNFLQWFSVLIVHVCGSVCRSRKMKSLHFINYNYVFFVQKNWYIYCQIAINSASTIYIYFKRRMPKVCHSKKSVFLYHLILFFCVALLLFSKASILYTYIFVTYMHCY